MGLGTVFAGVDKFSLNPDHPAQKSKFKYNLDGERDEIDSGTNGGNNSRDESYEGGSFGDLLQQKPPSIPQF